MELWFLDLTGMGRHGAMTSVNSRRAHSARWVPLGIQTMRFFGDLTLCCLTLLSALLCGPLNLLACLGQESVVSMASDVQRLEGSKSFELAAVQVAGLAPLLVGQEGARSLMSRFTEVRLAWV